MTNYELVCEAIKTIEDQVFGTITKGKLLSKSYYSTIKLSDIGFKSNEEIKIN